MRTTRAEVPNGNPQLVDLEQLKSLMNGVELSDQKLNEYINARWLNYVKWWDCRAQRPKRWYFAPEVATRGEPRNSSNSNDQEEGYR